MADFIEKGGSVSREHVWLTAWVAVAQSSNCVRMHSPIDWADDCLAAFDKRFAIRAIETATTGATHER